MSNAPTLQERASGGGKAVRTLVIGCGFIGSHIVEALAASPDHQPVVLTRTRPADTVTGLLLRGDLYLGDAWTPDVLERALDDIGHVIFAAGGLLPPASEKSSGPQTGPILAPVRSVLRALRSRPNVALTYLSSGGTVYGEPDRIPVDEDAPTRPLGAYGKLHLACEEEVIRDRDENGLRARILRCSTVYGEHQRPDRGQGAIVTFLHRIARGSPIDLYGSGTTIRDYIYAGDVARIVVALLDRDDGAPIVNVGAGEGTSLLEVLCLAEQQVGRRAQIIQHPERRYDVHRVVLDTKRLGELVDLPLTPLEAGVERTHRWLSRISLELA